MFYTKHDSPIGLLLLAADGVGLTGIYFSDAHRHFKGIDGWECADDHPHLINTVGQLDEYFAGKRRDFDLPLHMIGTTFQRAVWNGLLSIPFGQTASYAEQAMRIGHPRAVRAVGAANGRNPISIVVPCHRVVGTSGQLTGYAGGLEQKRFLLALENKYAAAQSQFDFTQPAR